MWKSQEASDWVDAEGRAGCAWCQGVLPVRLVVPVVWLTVSLAYVHPVHAQQPGRVIDRPSARALTTPAAQPDPEAAPEFVLPPVPPGDVDATTDGASLDIVRIVVNGSSVLSPSEIVSAVQPYQQRAVTLAEIEELRQALTRLYVDKGYINSGALIRSDAYADGILTIDIVEGRLDDVRVRGGEGLREGYIARRLWPDPRQVFNSHLLEDRYRLLLNDPLIARMDGEIQPGAQSGHAVLAVDVQRARPYQLTLFGNNYRPPSIGSEAFGLSGVVHNSTGLGDALDFTYLTSGGTSRFAGGWSVPVSDVGTDVFFRFDEGTSAVVEEPIAALGIESEVHILEGGISHAVLNTLDRRLVLGLLCGIRANETFADSERIPFIGRDDGDRNQVTVLRFFQDYFWRGEQQIMALRSTFSFGLDILGATPETRNSLPDGEFFSWLGQGQIAQRLTSNDTQVVLRGNVQISDDPLLPLERMAVGGAMTVRGYRENYLVRDNGYNATVELRYLLPGHLPMRLTAVPFCDIGGAWNWVPDRDESKRMLVSVGLGLEADYRQLHAELYYGHAFTSRTPL